MNEYNNLTTGERATAIQRLTALWAFCESGLGGVMHALKMPFTGLVIGGLAVIIISFIAQLSHHNLKELLRSLVIVLIVKAMVSPYTPFPAYIAVSFQALLGIAVFYLFRINGLSILLFSIIAMLESAIQQLLILTLFFGQSFWKATDRMFEFVAKQLGITAVNGSQWVIGIYLLIYVTGGILIALMSYRIIKHFFSETKNILLPEDILQQSDPGMVKGPERKRSYHKLWIMAIVMVILSVLLFVFAGNSKEGWLSVLKTVSWTVSVILAWYLLISPLFTKLILWLLQKKESRYSEAVSQTLSFIPVLRRLTAIAWQKSSAYKGWGRWQFFFSTLLHWSLTYSDQTIVTPAIKEPV